MAFADFDFCQYSDGKVNVVKEKSCITYAFLASVSIDNWEDLGGWSQCFCLPLLYSYEMKKV